MGDPGAALEPAAWRKSAVRSRTCSRVISFCEPPADQPRAHPFERLPRHAVLLERRAELRVRRVEIVLLLAV